MLHPFLDDFADGFAGHDLKNKLDCLAVTSRDDAENVLCEVGGQIALVFSLISANV